MNEPASEKSDVLTRLASARLIGIVRTKSSEDAVWAASQLIEAGLQAIEIPFTVPDAANVIETLTRQYPDALIGAGTVLEANQAIKALAAGARFLVSPVLIPSMLHFGKEHQVFVLPGCMTPTEMFDAMNLDAQAVKFFPAQATGGPEFIKAIKGPFPELQIVPTGGIGKEHATAYLQAGALAVGVGGPLLPNAMIQNRDVEGLKAHAKTFLAEATR